MRVVFIFLALAVAATRAPAGEPAQLRAAALPATVAIAPLAVGEKYVSLPALEFALDVATACPAEFSAVSLSISVADTRRGFSGPDIGAAVQTTLKLPLSQSIRLRVEDFCTVGDDPGARDTLDLADILTARLSLRCADGDSQSIVYATLPLGVRLQCAREFAEDGAAQESSVESATSL